MSDVLRHKVIELSPGFYSIRYFCEEVPSPIAILHGVSLDGKGSVSMIGATRGQSVMLSTESSMALLYVVGGRVSVTLSLLSSSRPKSGGASFEIERIPEQVPKNWAGSSSLLYLSGHVEWKGDIKVAPGTYLGAENGVSRIEGFSINWLKKPKNVDIKYGCTFGKLEETSTALGGGFVGSRRQAAPITSIWMELEGPSADQFDLQFRAVFSKSGPIDGRQSRVEAGTHEDDYLVGLWVSVDSADSNSSIAPSGNGKKVKELKTFRA